MKKVAAIQEKQRAEAAAAAARGEVGDAKKEGAAAITEADSEGNAAGMAATPHKPEITIDDFDKLELRVGEVVKCEAVPKSKKLLCSQVKIGNETKQIVSGIHHYYEPEEMVGKRVTVLVNLKPAKLAGILSEGMILCADDGNGGYTLVRPEADEVPSGGEIS
jgi:methionyl-tRNA synthetase